MIRWITANIYFCNLYDCSPFHLLAKLQWCSQGLEMGGHMGSGDGSPQWGTRQSPGEGLGAEPPEARYAYTICSGQTHFRDVFIEDIWCTLRLMRSLLPPPYISKNLFKFVQISRPTLAEVWWACAHPCPTMATPLLNLCINCHYVVSRACMTFLHATPLLRVEIAIFSCCLLHVHCTVRSRKRKAFSGFYDRLNQASLTNPLSNTAIG